jgi:hypothetical protein
MSRVPLKNVQLPRAGLLTTAAGLLVATVILLSTQTSSLAGEMLDIADLLARAEEYDKQMVVVVGRVANVQTATTRQGQSGYGFLLEDHSGTVKVVGLGKLEVHDGEQVIVEGVFSRLRQTGRAIVYNEIKATVIRPMDRLNPDLVG